MTADHNFPPSQCSHKSAPREIGWIDSGGGFSHLFSRPSYQDTLPLNSTHIPAGQRGVPDVGFQASSRTGVLIYSSEPGIGSSSTCPAGSSCDGWFVIGGTSASAPQWAGLVAIADQVNGGGLGLINPALYTIGANAARYANDFFDVTVGQSAGNPGGARTTIGLQHGAIEQDLAFAEFFEIDGGPQAATDQPADLLLATAADAPIPGDALRARRRNHRVLAGDPALTATLQE